VKTVVVAIGARKYQGPETHRTYRHLISLLGRTITWGDIGGSAASVLILPLTTRSNAFKVPIVKPEAKQQILPLGLLIAAIVCGGVSWVVDGTIFFVLVGLSLAFIVAGVVLAGRLESQRRNRQ
jgi:hypothetical protein